MTVTTEIHVDAGVVVNTVIGTLSSNDIMATLRELFADPRFLPGMGIVWDLRSGAVDRRLSGTGIQALRAFVASRTEARGRGRLAIVVSRDVDYGVGRMFEAYTDGLGIERCVFRDSDEAVCWASASKQP